MEGRISALDLAREIAEGHYRQAKEAHQRGGHVAWVNAIFPVELLYALDVVPVYPENHAVMISAKKMTLEVARAAEERGFSPDLCGYARCDLGSHYSGISPVGGLPMPDFLLTTNAQCGTLTEWFEVLSQELGVPLFLLDVPFPVDASSEGSCIRYVVHQLHDLVRFLQEGTGRELREERLVEILRISQETTAAWKETLSMTRAIPSPWTVFDQTIAMGPIVNRRGCQVALEFYGKLREEMDQRVKKGVAAVEGERHRLFMGNLPIWHDLRAFSEFFRSHRVCLAASSYVRVWSDLSVSPEDPFQGWAEKLVHFDLGIRGRAELIVEMMRDYSLDGFILYSNRSCKIASFGVYDIMETVSERTGVPGLLFEADHADPRRYSATQVRARLEAYFELLDQGREAA